MAYIVVHILYDAYRRRAIECRPDYTINIHGDNDGDIYAIFRTQTKKKYDQISKGYS